MDRSSASTSLFQASILLLVVRTFFVSMDTRCNRLIGKI
jgi:hypothetical protein